MTQEPVVHGQISLYSSRIVETLATYCKLDTTITHLYYLDLKILFRFFSTVTAAATYKQQILDEYGQNTAPVPRAPVIASALIYNQ